MLKELPEHNNVTKCITELYKRERALLDALAKEAEAKREYKLAFAKAFLQADGGADLRKQQATLETDRQYIEHLKTEAAVVGLKIQVADAQDVLSARQSLLSASAKADFAYANSRGTT